MSGVLLGWTGDDGPDVEADARRALTEWAAPADDLNPADQRQAARKWKRWCAAAAAWGVNPNPNPDLPRHLAAYALALLDAGYAPSSVQNALAGLDWWCRTQFTVNGTPVRVPGMTRHAGLVLKAWAAEFLVVPGRGEVPVPRAWLVKVAEAMRADGSPIACRDLTMLTWGYSAGLRRGELGVIGVEDLTVDTDWIGWAFVSSKGNQTGARDDDRAAVGRTDDALCPLAARDLLRDAGWDPTLPTAPVIPAFKAGGGGGLPDPADPTVEGISGDAVLRRLGYWAERAGVPHPELVTPHGLRHSRATHLRLGGASDAEVQRVLRHTSRATTMRYIAGLSPWVEPGSAAEVMLGDTGDGYADLDLPRKAAPRQRGAPVDWGDLTGRLAVADDLARLGPYAPATRRQIGEEVGRWDDWREERGLTDTEPSVVQVLAWTAWRIDTATNTDHPLKAVGVPPKAETMRRSLRCFEAGLASRGTAAGTVTGPAFDALAGYARRADVKARAARKSAPVFDLDELEVLAFVAGCPSESDTRRWAVGLAALALHHLDTGRPGPGGGGGFLPVPPSAVQAPGPDTRLVTVEGRDPITVTRGSKPPLDAVAALDWLLANTPDGTATILDPHTLTRAKMAFKREGTKSPGKLVSAGLVERAGWRLAAPLVRAVRAQAVIAAMTGGALRYDDLAGVRLERVHDVPGGLAAPLLDKGGTIIEGSDVWFETDPARPALDFPTQFARLTAWLPWGAHGPLATSCKLKNLLAGTPTAPLTPEALMRAAIGPAAEQAGITGLQLHSFRRSAATALWWRLRADGVPDTEAVERVQRKLRHADPTVTVNHYIAVIDPGWSAAADLPAHDPTTELCDARQEVHPTVHVDAA